MNENVVNSQQNSEISQSVFTREVLDSAYRFDREFNARFLDDFSLPYRVCHHLDECLALYTKDVLMQIGLDHMLDLKVAMKKEKMVELLRQKIIQDFHEFLAYLPVRNLEFLKEFTYENNYTLTRDVFLFPEFTHLHHYGFLFLFKGEDEYTAVLPGELGTFLGLLNNKDLYVKADVNERLDAYATSLVNLYGILDIDQFAILWNKYEKETLTPAMVEDELKALDRAHIFWWYLDEYVVSTYFTAPEEVEEYLKEVKDVTYYMPDREELRNYFITPYDKSTPAAHAMTDFLSSVCQEGYDTVSVLMQDLNDAITVGEKMDDVFELLGEYGVFFHGVDELNTFHELFGDLDETVRKWQLKGHRPHYLKNNQNHSLSN